MAYRRGIGPVFEADFRLALKEKIDVLSASERVEALLGYKPKEFLLSTIFLGGPGSPSRRCGGPATVFSLVQR
jgi:hypothetical protein